MGAVLAFECERARKWASLGLDEELSQVERALLRAHVGRCPRCAEFAGDLEGLTHELRAAPLERAAPVPLVPVHRRAGRIRVLQLAAAAAAVAVAATLGSLAGSLSSRQPAATATAQFPLKAFRVAALRPAELPGTRLTKSTPV